MKNKSIVCVLLILLMAGCMTMLGAAYVVPDIPGGVSDEDSGGSSKDMKTDTMKTEALEAMFAASKQEYDRRIGVNQPDPLVNAREKLMRITITAGNEMEFVAEMLTYGEYRSIDSEEHALSKMRLRFHFTNSGYQADEKELGGTQIVEGLAPVNYCKEYGVLTEKERWYFYMDGAVLKLIDFTTGAAQVVPLGQNNMQDGEKQQDAALKYSYGYMGGQLTAACGSRENGVTVVRSSDGKVWQSAQIDELKGHTIENLFISFSSEENGLIAVDADRQMGFHSTMIFLTQDGGSSWRQLTSVPKNYEALFGVSRSESRIFLCYNHLDGPVKDDGPSFFCSDDNGETWQECTIPVPKGLEGSYNTICPPQFDGLKGTLLLTGGEGIRARYLSQDGGLTWRYDKEVSLLDF